MDIDKQILGIAIAARKASNELSSLSTSLKNQVLTGIADALTDKREFLKSLIIMTFEEKYHGFIRKDIMASCFETRPQL